MSTALIKNLGTVRQDWAQKEVGALFRLPMNDLLFYAHKVYRDNFDPNQIQISSLLSVKTGGCSEDCKYCSQSARYDSGLAREKLMDVKEVLTKAKAVKAQGHSRFCMGAAWRSPKPQHMAQLVQMVSKVKDLGLETCMTLGMLDAAQAEQLKTAGLDYYNHNLDTSERYYSEVITTRSYQDRLDTLSHVREAGIKTCCGGIIGMGESRADRVGLLTTLANLPAQPDSVPINRLVPISGTPYEKNQILDEIEFIKTVAVARILMPKSYVRLSAGRETMSDSMQALCFFAGANSMFAGEQLLTTPNVADKKDENLLGRLGLNT